MFLSFLPAAANWPDMDMIWKSLSLMGKGMLGIFIVMVIIFLLIVVLGKVFKNKDEEK